MAHGSPFFGYLLDLGFKNWNYCRYNGPGGGSPPKPEDGFPSTSPVGSFPPNTYGRYDMAGDLWQWTSDWYRADAFAEVASQGTCHNPSGPKDSFDPTDPYAPKRVIKGGSFLCNASYCESYRPSARRGTPSDTGSSHVGFRCVKTINSSKMGSL
jgi:formylglycine-generating enzyme required for sulfatase activity